jgi:hypothetical protein
MFLAERLEIAGGRWRSETHVMVSLWSAEVMHAARLRPETFRSACPDPPADFSSWWAGQPPNADATSSAFVLLDPGSRVADGRRFASLETALRVRPRYRDYADAVVRLKHRA